MAGPGLKRYNASELNLFPIAGDYYSCVSEEDEMETIIFHAGGNVEQRISLNTTVRREWVLKFPAITSAQKVTLQAFFLDQKAEMIPFKWVSDVDGETYFVRFSGAKIHYEQIYNQIWRVQCTLRQIGSHEINTEA